MRRGNAIARSTAVKALAPRRHATSTTTTTTTAIPGKPLTSILIANRGEIALSVISNESLFLSTKILTQISRRVNKTASQHGIKTTTIYTDPDRLSQHALSSSHSINLGPSTEYLNGPRIIEIAKQHGCSGVHPGYGFLSENSTFARNCVDAGLVFIGPPWQAMEAMGNKSRSKEIMTAAGVPCIPGYHGQNQDPEHLLAEAEKVGFPVLLKAVKGGGGKGMRIAMTRDVFLEQLKAAKSEAMSSFGDEVMLVEKYIQTPRHIEVQVFADKHGNCVALGERDCSIQRRHQKILEESPAPKLDESVRQDLFAKARAAAVAVGYEGAGTVEFIFDNETGEFFFMEMNTRLQVEHPVTEMVTGEDLVRWQIIVAEGGQLPLDQATVEARIAERGHAIEARIYAENPEMDFIPDSGKLIHLQLPKTSETVRVDAGFVEGDEVSSHYDPMIAKLIVQGETRAEALQKLHAALEEYEVAGVITNIEFLKRVVTDSAFKAGDVQTGYIKKHSDTLYAKTETPPEVYAQAALGSFFTDIITQNQQMTKDNPLFPTLIPQPGFISSSQSRTFHFSPAPSTTSQETATTTTTTTTTTTPPPPPISVTITPLTHPPNPNTLFSLHLPNKSYPSLTSTYHPSTHTLTTYFPHTRISTRFIHDPTSSSITLFHHGTLHTLHPTPPPFLPLALGVPDTVNSVVAPMPCKIHRVEVSAGQVVTKGQVLVVIESMKMETAIRSPLEGVKVKRVVHGEGEIVRAGVALVEFEEEEEGVEGSA